MARAINIQFDCYPTPNSYMTSYVPTPLLCVQLLANPQRRLAALRWLPLSPEAELDPAQPPLDLDGLPRHVTCLWAGAVPADGWPPAWSAAGWQADNAAALVWCEDDVRPGMAQPWIAGGWYLQPPVSASAAQAASRTRALQLLQMVSADADTRELEAVFRQDPALSYQLLRVVNSLAMRGQRQITSFSQAILIMGRQQLRRWLHLLLFTARDDDPRSAMLMVHVLQRARGLELLAHEAGLDRSGQDQAFMTGMFSMLGTLFGQPLTQVLQPLNLTDDLSAALLERQGELGRLLAAWEAMEHADAAKLRPLLQDWCIGDARFNAVLVESFNWLLELTHGELGGPAHG